MPSSPGKTVGSVSAGMLDFIPLYLGFWRAYWQGVTVGTRPQRHVIVILFFLLSWIPLRAVLAFLLRLSNAVAFLLSRSLAPHLFYLSVAGSYCQSCRAVCSPHDAHSSLLSSFALRIFFAFLLTEPRNNVVVRNRLFYSMRQSWEERRFGRNVKSSLVN